MKSLLPATLEKLLFILPKEDPFKLVVLFILMMIAAGLEVAGVGMIPAFVAVVAAPERVLETEWIQPILGMLGIASSQDLLIWGSAGLVGIFIFKSIYIIIFNYFESRFIYNRRYTISHRLMSSYMQAPYTFHLQRNTAELLRNMTRDISIVVNIVITNLLTMGREGIMTIAILIFLLAFEPLITLGVILLSGLGIGSFLFYTQERIKEYGEEEQESWAKMIKAINQGLGGIKDVRILNREAEFIDKFGVESYRSTRKMAYIRFVQQIPKPVVETSAVIGMMLIVAFMVWQGRPMEVIIPVLTLFAIATVRLMPSIQQLSSLYTNFRYNMVAVDPIYQDLKELEEYSGRLIEDRKKENKLELKHQIEVRDVSYQYPESEEQALNGVTISIPRGKSVAFVGQSGAGKTTMIDVLLGLLEPTKGTIYVDGVDIQDRVSAWQKNIGYIPQSIYLADESLRNNIAFGLPDKEIDDRKVVEAVNLAQLDSLIRKLPKGLDTIVGEHGTRLSGGQRQRVGIARALYHNPQVLVMDEATSALDNITEKQITNAIEALKGERTLIMIAHRLTTVQNCDILYLMRDGKIVDQGTYEELVATNKEFKKMALVD